MTPVAPAHRPMQSLQDIQTSDTVRKTLYESHDGGTMVVRSGLIAFGM